MKDQEYIKNVASLKLNQDKCTGCGMCVTVCPHPVFELKDKKVYIKNINACMECGACQTNCPEGALEVKPGVGCAAAVIMGAIKGTEPTCGCSDNPSSSCCG
ncbi:mercury methylation ferredoxin HgcB [Candidatus Margulisiibacteriota bacterium]